MMSDLKRTRIVAVAAGLLLCGSFGLSGCAQLDRQIEAGANASAGERLSPTEAVLALLRYAQSIRAMGGKELTDETERLRQAQGADKSDFLALQYAVALSAPGASVASQRRALQLLEPFATMTPAEGSGGEFHALAALLRADLAERRRLEDIAYTQTQKLREEQRRAEELERKVDAATKKLEALINIERNLLQRGKASGAGK